MPEHCVAIVIPHFQRSAAPLERALASVERQVCAAHLHVVLVDDGSPEPAGPILTRARANHPRWSLTLCEQANAGAALARNVALERLPREATAVAFLDSDDEWAPDHLSQALTALDAGLDLVFADHRRGDWAESKFRRLGVAASAHTALPGLPDICAWRGTLLVPVMRDHLIQTSGVVCRAALAASCRFPTDLVLGEDEVYWMQLIQRAGRVGMVMREMVQMGRGVNISQGGTWGDDRSVRLMLQNVTYWSSVVRKLPDESGLPALQLERLAMLRRELLRTWLHRLRRGRTALGSDILRGLLHTWGTSA